MWGAACRAGEAQTDEVFTERSAQIRTKEEVQCMQQEEDRVFAPDMGERLAG